MLRRNKHIQYYVWFRASFEPAYPSVTTPSTEESWNAFVSPAPPHEPKVTIEYYIFLQCLQNENIIGFPLTSVLLCNPYII